MGSGERVVVKIRSDRAALDNCDLQILAELQVNGRITKTELARRVHLSATACWDRLRRLEECGIIEGYHARLNPTVMTGATVVLVEVVLDRHRAEDQRAFESAVREVPEILDCWATGGGIDYLLRVVAPSVDDYQILMERLLEAEIGIDRYFSYIVTKPVKENTPLPLATLIDH